MSGGITQLVATGVQDAYLSGSPEVSFFRSNYKRYTHFASTVERQLIQGEPGNNSVSTVRFEKKGDLLSQVYLTAIDTRGATVTKIDWENVIDKIELLIGGQVIDTQDQVYTNEVEPVVGASSFSTKYSETDDTSSSFYPLKFFFCKDWQSALPLVALQYHDVELRITWGSNIKANSGDSVAPASFVVWSKFIYLDKDERDFIAKKSHDILITQVSRSVITNKSTYEFALAQPVKFIAFKCKDYATEYTSSQTNAAKYTFKVQINGNDIGETRTLDHWTYVNQYYLTPFGYRSTGETYPTSSVAIIPFCLDTSKLQPTGTLNFSRIDTFRLVCPPGTSFQDFVPATSKYFYAVSYNVLRIQNGMAGILYAS